MIAQAPDLIGPGPCIVAAGGLAAMFLWWVGHQLRRGWKALRSRPHEQ